MKKFLLLLIACLFVIPTASYASAANDRTEEGLVPDFSEDFESYEVDTWIENFSLIKMAVLPKLLYKLKHNLNKNTNRLYYRVRKVHTEAH